MLKQTNLSRSAFNESSIMSEENMSEYTLGAKDSRVWGTWEVISEPSHHEGHVIKCDKEIVVYPHHALSLQMHEKRGEIWTVAEGELTAIVNDEKRVLKAGETLVLQQGDIHCMVNLTGRKLVVHETQTGICEEADNIRIMDASGRSTTNVEHPHVDAAKKLYAGIMAELTAVECNIKKVL